MDNAEKLRRLQVLRSRFRTYAPLALKIKDKSGGVVPFKLNKAQEALDDAIEQQLAETGRVRVLVLKGRQQGISTYTEGRFYWRTSLQFGKTAYILTHEDKATQNLFGMAKLYHEHVPPGLMPSTGAANANELVFDRLASKYAVGTARTKGTGRSSTVQYFHGCLSPESWIVDGMTGALRRMDEFSVGDIVRTRTGEIAPVSFISRQQKLARSVVMKGMGQTPLVATDEHRFWTRDGWKCLRDIRVGDVIGFPVAKINDAVTGWPFRLQDAIRPQGGGSRETGPDRVAPDYRLGRVLGLYLAEGCITKQSKTKVPSAVTFAVHEREVARTVEWLESVSGLFVSAKVAPRKDSKTVAVTAYGKSFASFVLAHCGELDGKRLPAGWERCGTEFVRGMVHGYLAGDGHSSTRPGDRRISAPSIRSAITVGMRDALAALGYGWACIGWRDGAVRNGRNERAQWTLRLSGSGVDRLAAEIGWSMPPRKRSGSYGDVRIDGGFAWVPVVSIGESAMADVMDFEVDHKDHSYCTLQGATHNSEVAFWANAADHLAGLGQAIPDEPGTEVVLESTANGVGNMFHSMVQDAQRGIGDYRLVFIPWFWQPEYRAPIPDGFVMDADEAAYAERYGLEAQQMAWRRRKIQTDFRGDVALFDQEYPATPALAFRAAASGSYIGLELVDEAMNTETGEDDGAAPKIMGVDPAEYGDDSTAIVRRQGRRVFEVMRRNKLGTMQVAGLVAIEADKWGPEAINVDCTGIGSGVADRLAELGYPVNRVHFGESAIENDQYGIRKDEMWGRMKAWLENRPCELPRDDVLAADLVGPQFTYDSSRRLRIESKEKMKARGLRSPDSADALALTFAVDIAPKAKRAPERRFNWRVG